MLSVSTFSDQPVAGSSANGPSSFVWKYCRMCALEVKQGVYIFGEEGKRLQIPEKIRKTVAILVLEEDSLPKKICTNCCTSLEAYTQFKDAVVDAQDKLGSIAKSIEKSHEQSLLHLRNRQYMRSPKRPKLYHQSITPQTGNALVPAPALLCGDNDLGDPPMECDDAPSSVVSSDDDEIPTSSKAVPVPAPECSSVETSTRDEDTQEPLRGSSPLQPSNKIQAPAFSSEMDSESPPEPPDLGDKLENSRHYSSDGDEETKEHEAHLICGLCTAKTKDKEAMVAHHTEYHHDHKINKDSVYGCSACPRTSCNYEAIRQHIYRHRMAGTFKCADCDKSYSTKDQLDVHVSSKHNPVGTKPFSCNVCGKQYGTNIALAAHQRKKHPPTSTVVKYHKSDQNKEVGTVVAANLLEVSPSSSTTRVPVHSSPTKLQNNSPTKLQHNSPTKLQHNSPTKLQHNSPTKLNTANTGGLVTADSEGKRDVTANLNSEENKLQENPEGSVSATTNDDHTNTEFGYWKCDYCDKILHTKHGYDSHVSVHKGRRFTCDHCGVTYTQKVTLDHHVKVHHTNIDKEFECPECKKSFKTFRQLTWHKKIHDKPLTDITCPQCEKKFVNMCSLKTHMKLHRGSKKFACTTCPKSFYTKLKLEEHMNSHTGRRPYGCPIDKCTKVFSCVSNFCKHFKKHHFELLGPRGSMIPQPKIMESNNNNISSTSASVVKPVTQNDSSKSSKKCPQQFGSTVIVSMEKEAAETTTMSSCKSQGEAQPAHSNSSCVSAVVSESQSQQQNHVVAHMPVTSSPVINTHTPVATRTSGVVSSTGLQNVSTVVGQTSTNSSSSSPLQAPVSTGPHFTSSSINNCHTITLHSSNFPTASETSHPHPTIAHNHSFVAVNASSQPHAHHHPSNLPSSHGSHSHNHQTGGGQTQSANQFQQQIHNQSVWQPVVLPGSKTYHHSSTASLASLNGLDLLECGGSISAHSSEPMVGGTGGSHAHSHSHSQPTGLNVIQVPQSVAHHSSHSAHVHHHPINIPSSSGNHQIPGSGHGPSSNTVPSGHNLPVSSSSSLSVSNFATSQQNEPMELSYKLDSNNFQEMPMELTKVFQRDPLELCVRQDFPQPLMDLSSRVVNVTVAANPSMTVSSLSMNLNGSSQAHYGSATSGGTSTSNMISIPYHKTVELVERELSLNDFTGAFRQPIDLIARSDDHANEVCSEGSLVDLSLRSSFGQDHSASSFLRELIDLSSRSDSFHGEVNLTNKQHPSASSQAHHPQIHHHSHSHPSTHHPPPNRSTGSHHHHNHHHHHHPHNLNPTNQSSSGSGSVAFQNVIYQDSMFSLQN